MTLLALCGVSVFAGGKVEVANDVSNGTITGQVNGTQVTLTVTPAEGFFIRKADLVAEKTFMPVAASRRRVPIADQLTIEGEDPADLSQQRTYTLTLPSVEYDVLIHANFTQRTLITREMVKVSGTRFIYNTGVQRPVVSISGLTEGRDYEVVYSDPASTEAGNYSLTVNGLSTYHGSHNFTYAITRGGNAEVNSDIVNGSVKAVVDGLTLTLTVTPADGYYFQKKNLRVDKTYMPVAARSTTPISDELAIVGDDPDDLSLPRTYTVEIPAWEFDVWIDATFTPRTPLTDAMVKLSASTFVYNGKDQKPTVTLSGLTEGRDYTLTFDETEWKHVGSYGLSVRGESTYKGTISKTFTITKAMPVVTPPVANKLTFNREQQVLAQAGEVEGGEMWYSLAQNGTYTTTVPQVTDAGTYTLYYKVVGDSNHQDVAAKTMSVTVSPKVVDMPVIELSQQTYVYDGTAKQPTVMVKDVTVEIPASEYTISYASNVNAGEAKVTIKDKDAGNYTVSGSASFVIEKAPAVVTTAPKAAVLTFNREAQALIVAGTADGGEMQYALAEEGPFATSVPMATDAATYTVYYKVAGNSNHLDTEVGSLSVTISPKEVGSPVIELSQQTYVYDGMKKKPSVTVKDGSVVIPASEYSVSYASNVNVGEAEVSISDNEAGNYTVSGSASFTIEKAPAVVTMAPVAAVLTFNREAQALIVAGTADGGEMMYGLDKDGLFSATIPTGTDAGTYTVYYKVLGDSNHFDSEIGNVNATIAPKTLDAPVIALGEEMLVYDGKAKEPAVTVADGSILIDESEYSVTYASNVNAGEAEVMIIDEEGGNYTVSGHTTFTIGKALLNAIADNKMMEKGEPMPELTVRYKGFVDNDSEEVLLTPSVAKCEEITDTVSGVYQIFVSGGEALNYDFSYVNGTLTIYVPVILEDEAGNELEASITEGGDTCHVVITELTEEMLNGTQDIPAELKGGEGDTYQVTEVASEAFEEMPSSVIIELPEGVSTTNPVTNVINGDGTCETLDLTDVDGFGAKKTLEVEEVIYEREIDSDVMTVCLPYSIEVPENVVVFELDADADGGVSFVSVSGDSLEAYQPYLMQPKMEENLARRAGDAETATLSLGAKNVSIAPTQEDVAVSAGVFVLCGTVRGLTHAEGLELKAYVMQPDHTWKMTASRAPEDANKPYLGAFQAYMQLIGGTGNEVIDTEMNDLTAILHVTKEAAPAIDGWYDLMGRKLPGKPSKGGLYIYQGKKVSF